MTRIIGKNLWIHCQVGWIKKFGFGFCKEWGALIIYIPRREIWIGSEFLASPYLYES